MPFAEDYALECLLSWYLSLLRRRYIVRNAYI
jgi:hypothetical protein